MPGAIGQAPVAGRLLEDVAVNAEARTVRERADVSRPLWLAICDAVVGRRLLVTQGVTAEVPRPQERPQAGRESSPSIQRVQASPIAELGR